MKRAGVFCRFLYKHPVGLSLGNVAPLQRQALKPSDISIDPFIDRLPRIAAIIKFAVVSTSPSSQLIQLKSSAWSNFRVTLPPKSTFSMSTQPEDTQGSSCVNGQLALLDRKLSNLDNWTRLVDDGKLSTGMQIATFLYICHTGRSFSDISRTYDVGATKIQEVFENVRDALVSIFDEYVKIREMPDGIKGPELLDDPTFAMFRTTSVKVVGAAVVCGIGRCSTQPDESFRRPSEDYTGPQKLLFTIDLRGRFTSVYAPCFDNTMCDDACIYDMARAEGCLPNLSHGKWLLAATPNLMFSGHQLIGAFPDAEYPIHEEELESYKPRDGHGRFNLSHSRLYQDLAVRPLTTVFWSRFPLLSLPDARVSADVFKACVVAYNFFLVEK